MTNSFKTMVAMAMVVGVALSVPVPADDKSDLSNEIIQSGGFSTKNEASASWGGFQASASLADDGSVAASAGGNGVSAGAGYGAGGASAGSSGTPTKPNIAKPIQHGNGFFDRIFAIPINVLQSVNTYLNQKQVPGQHGGSVHQNASGDSSAASVASSSAAGSASYGGSGKDAVAGADYGHADSTGKPGSPMMIPITALRSVQNLLNG